MVAYHFKAKKRVLEKQHGWKNSAWEFNWGTQPSSFASSTPNCWREVTIASRYSRQYVPRPKFSLVHSLSCFASQRFKSKATFKFQTKLKYSRNWSSFSDDFDVLALKQRSNVLLSDSNKQINSKFFKEKLWNNG